MSRKRVLFLCTHNSARSQMAEGLLRDRYGDHYAVFSAGTEATEVRPLAVEVMDEIGIDISDHTSDTLAAVADEPFDVVVTVCDDARERCPHLPGKTTIHASFDDPSAATGSDQERRAVFRSVRDALADWIEEQFRPDELRENRSS